MDETTLTTITASLRLLAALTFGNSIGLAFTLACVLSQNSRIGRIERLMERFWEPARGDSDR